MKKTLALAGALMCVLSWISVPATAAPVTVNGAVDPAQVETILGDRFTLETEVRNTGDADSGPLLAHLNVASLEESVYVDPEDWSPERSQALSLRPGETRTLSWELQAVNSGRFAAYVVVLPSTNATVSDQDPVVTPLVGLNVATRTTLNAGGALPVVLGVPLVIGLTAVAARLRRRKIAGTRSHPARNTGHTQVQAVRKRLYENRKEKSVGQGCFLTSGTPTHFHGRQHWTETIPEDRYPNGEFRPKQKPKSESLRVNRGQEHKSTRLLKLGRRHERLHPD